jgi:hypothetical protein
MYSMLSTQGHVKALFGDIVEQRREVLSISAAP